MAQKKRTKKSKVRDLKPIKDVKGGIRAGSSGFRPVGTPTPKSATGFT